MVNQEHFDLLKQGVDEWNKWREECPNIRPDLTRAFINGLPLKGANLKGADLRGTDFRKGDLRGADLNEADLKGAYFRGANLSEANFDEAKLNYSNFRDAYLIGTHLRGADLRGANFTGANLSFAELTEANLSDVNLRFTNFNQADLRKATLRKAILTNANLRGADFTEANLSEANLRGANLSETNLKGANLNEADLSHARLIGTNLSKTTLIETNLTESILTNCSVYGISAWQTKLQGARQEDLTITSFGEPSITVDNLEVAQFIYLLLSNERIRSVIDTITSKVVLILGRFTPERKVILDAIRDELRTYNYLSVLFDFEKPASRDLTETVNILAHLARFIIVDLTDPSSAPHEVATVIPHMVVPVQPLISQEPLIVDGKVRERSEYAMFEDLRRRYHWVLPTFRYQNVDELLGSLQAHIIAPAEQKARELMRPK